jgi:hypothetical protein
MMSVFCSLTATTFCIGTATTRNKEMGKESVIFAGCARDCEQYLPSVLKNVDRISSLFSQSAFLICENDSTDATRKILSDWGSAKTNFDLANLDGLVKSKTRTMRLEFARNALVEIIRSWEVVNSFKYLFLLDFDKANIRELDVQQLSTAMEWMTAQKNIAAIFPNQIGPYYDMWALRHQTYCPTDVWEASMRGRGSVSSRVCQANVYLAADRRAPGGGLRLRRFRTLSSQLLFKQSESVFGVQGQGDQEGQAVCNRALPTM